MERWSQNTLRVVTASVFYVLRGSLTSPFIFNNSVEMYDEIMTHKHIQQMFSEESDDDDDECFGFESILLILVHLIHRFNSRGFIGPKTGASYT